MHLPTKCLLAIVFTIPLQVVAQSFLTDENVKYRGDTTAIKVCRAIVNDDTAALKKGLKRIKGEALYAYMFDINSPAILKSVTCNKMALSPFADEIGARNITNWLNNGTVTVEEFVSSTK
jgi:hypothetical protein